MTQAHRKLKNSCWKQYIEEELAEFKVKVNDGLLFGLVITRYKIEPDVGVRSAVLNLEKTWRSLGVASIRGGNHPGKTRMGLELLIETPNDPLAKSSILLRLPNPNPN